MTPLWQFLGLLAVHWVGDFFLQSHWMSVNKSKRFDALAMHVVVYTVTLAVGTALIFGVSARAGLFVVLNGILHLATDAITSRWSSRLWGQAFRPDRDGETVPFYPPRTGPIHNFFVVIGVDQYIHQFTLAATMWWLLT